MKTTTPLLPGFFFHIYNRGNNQENLFRISDNFEYFLRLYAVHVLPIADTYAYCLMCNHFHLVVRIKDRPGENLSAAEVSKPFSNLFNAYARSFNRAYGRSGALFQRPFSRILVEDDSYLSRLIVYIHQNPQRHGFVRNFLDWPYSSIHNLLSSRRSFLPRRDVLDYFGGLREFSKSHKRKVKGRDLGSLAPEDFDGSSSAG
jgi:putative transposase